jgi:hypothetical protein
MTKYIALTSLLFSFCTFSKVEIVTVDSYSKVENKILNFVDNESIVVFDIDDTLLHIPNCLDVSFNAPTFALWQIIARECEGEITENKVKTIIESLQSRFIDTMALTARGGNMIDLTITQIKDLGLEFDLGEMLLIENFDQKMTKTKSLYFRDGLAWASGTSKGKALVYFQKEKYSKPYKKIVFVDDNIKNIKSVNNSFKKDKETDVLIIHYTKFD